jgi:hypothetical protein
LLSEVLGVLTRGAQSYMGTRYEIGGLSNQLLPITCKPEWSFRAQVLY